VILSATAAAAAGACRSSRRPIVNKTNPHVTHDGGGGCPAASLYAAATAGVRRSVHRTRVRSCACDAAANGASSGSRTQAAAHAATPVPNCRVGEKAKSYIVASNSRQFHRQITAKLIQCQILTVFHFTLESHAVPQNRFHHKLPRHRTLAVWPDVLC